MKPIYYLTILVLAWAVAVQFDRFRWAVIRWIDRKLDRRPAKVKELTND